MIKKKQELIDVVRGTGNVFQDFDLPNPDLEQLRSILAARILRVLDEECLTVRKAQALTGFAAADFSRIRHADLGRFTTDRLMDILYRLGQKVEISVKIKPRPNFKQDALHSPSTSAA